jgi:hypothetical protein
VKAALVAAYISRYLRPWHPGRTKAGCVTLLDTTVTIWYLSMRSICTTTTTTITTMAQGSTTRTSEASTKAKAPLLDMHSEWLANLYGGPLGHLLTAELSGGPLGHLPTAETYGGPLGHLSRTSRPLRRGKRDPQDPMGRQATAVKRLPRDGRLQQSKKLLRLRSPFVFLIKVVDV